MSIPVRTRPFFVAGGTLQPSVRSYVTRPADDELYEQALAGNFCYVLTPRQMGKSSLMVRVAKRLQTQEVRTAIIDLSEVGTVRVDEWFLAILLELRRNLGLAVEPEVWWYDNATLSPLQRFRDFLIDVVLTELDGRIVIFVDEIDSTIDLPFRDDFFAAIRALYNRRARDPELNRLTFVLLGVASPSDLIKDRTRTPFNIGHEIQLDELSLEDATILKDRLIEVYPLTGGVLFNRIFYWTGGHPYLTQQLCLSVTETDTEGWTVDDLDKLVERTFLSDEARGEANIRFVNDKILMHPQKRELLTLYRKILQGRTVRADIRSPDQVQLKLSGLVKEVNGHLRVRNEIYRQAFDLAWVRRHMAINWQLILTVASVGITLLLLGVLLYNSLWLPERAQDSELAFGRTEDSTVRASALVELFKLRPLFGEDYDRVAFNLYYNETNSWEEQAVIFNEANFGDIDELVQLIKGLYVTMAEVDGSGNTTAMLVEMLEALSATNGDETEAELGLKVEIQAWLDGRQYFQADDCTNALSSYGKAININRTNPATLYERAKTHMCLSNYESALSDLEQVSAIAAERPEKVEVLSESTNQPNTTPISTDGPSMTQPVTSSSGESADERLTVTRTAQITITIEPSETVATDSPAPPTPTALPNLKLGQNFATRLDIENAIRILVDANSPLVSILASSDTDAFPNLHDSGLVPTVTPTPDIDVTASVNETQTAAADVGATADAATAEAEGDDDGDGLSNSRELELGTDPANPDTDGDGLNDGQEVNQYGTSPNQQDTDGDTLSDGAEVNEQGTSPNNPDTDGDGTPDGIEVNTGSDPLRVPIDTPAPNGDAPPSTASLGDTWTRPADGMVMVYVPAGRFMMGSDQGDDDERPVHEVSLDAFWIDRTEVTNGQYSRCVADGECEGVGFAVSGNFYGDDQPIISVGWSDAEAYCAWAGGQLPTEAQWEYAARGEESFVYPWGDDFDGQLLNFCDTNCFEDWKDEDYDDGYELTAPVGSYPDGATWVGAYDMAGNVSEWVADWYDSDYYDVSPSQNPSGPASGRFRVLRGGSWNNSSENARSSDRHLSDPPLRLSSGFRCAAPGL